MKASITKVIFGKATQTFRNEIHIGLQKSPKQLPSKYFYDQKGDALFQQIMAMPEFTLQSANWTSLEVIRVHWPKRCLRMEMNLT